MNICLAKNEIQLKMVVRVNRMRAYTRTNVCIHIMGNWKFAYIKTILLHLLTIQREMQFNYRHRESPNANGGRWHRASHITRCRRFYNVS